MPFRWYQYPGPLFTFLTLVVQVLITPLYKPGKIRWRAGCFEIVDDTPGSMETDIIGNPGGQTFGARIIWFNMKWFVDRRIIPVHERVHIHDAELVNGIAHIVLVPPAFILAPDLGAWLPYAAIVLAQAAFALSYGVHFLWEWGKLGFDRKRWREAYEKIWTERRAYRKDDEFERGECPDAWGA